MKSYVFFTSTAGQQIQDDAVIRDHAVVVSSAGIWVHLLLIHQIKKRKTKSWNCLPCISGGTPYMHPESSGGLLYLQK